MRLHWVLLGIILLSMTSAAEAQRNRLSIGDSAPSLSVETWVHGQETSLQRGNVYVVEFWATWCAPCVQAIPKLSRFQRQHRNDGLVIIGISDEEETTVRSFVNRRGSDIDFTIGIDRRDQTRRAWMRAANRSGIPTAFIVDREGRIQFIGNPHDSNFEQVLQAVLNGRYDARLFGRAEPVLEAAASARRLRNWNQTIRLYDEVIELDQRVFALVHLDKFEMMLVDMNDKERAYKYAEELLNQYRDDAHFLISLASKIANDPKIPDEKRNLNVAMKAADRAGESLGNNHPRGLAIRAEINYHLGNIDEAIRYQRRAWMVALPEQKSRYERTLQAYRDTQTRIESRAR